MTQYDVRTGDNLKLPLTLLMLFQCIMGFNAIADECGLTSETTPDFSLLDQNPTSPTFGDFIHRADLKGDVFVAYWAHAS